jgi:hypothetical protein
VELAKAVELQREQQWLEQQAQRNQLYYLQQEQAPADWAEAIDPCSGKTYYWNEATKETRWDGPQSYRVSAEYQGRGRPRNSDLNSSGYLMKFKVKEERARQQKRAGKEERAQQRPES